MNYTSKSSNIEVVLFRIGTISFSLGILIAFLVTAANGQENENFNSPPLARGGGPQRQGNFAMMGSLAYRLEVSRLLVKEANQAATELSLPDNLPISAGNLARLMILPPRIAKGIQGLGSVVTSNYIYYVACGYKFSGLTRAHLQQEDNQLISKFVLPKNQMNTNAAFQLATHFLSLASMDVTALNRDCTVQITTSSGPDYEHFVPIYTVLWTKSAERFGKVASVEVFLPDKSLRQLRVTRSEYILSQPVQITNPDFLNLPDAHIRDFRPQAPPM